MKRIFIIIVLLSYGLGFSQQNKLTYIQIKAKANKDKITLKNENFEVQSKAFTNSLLNNIFPYWYGTKWSFEGHTEIPKRGFVACGYFVSTTLRDLGIKLNRYKLAQLAPAHAAKVLSMGTLILEISGSDTNENIKKIQAKTTDGLYFIGYDEMHVGFLLKENNQLYLIHSNYLGKSEVEREKIEVSKVFDMCEKFYIVPLSTNKKLIESWINEKIIAIN